MSVELQKLLADYIVDLKQAVETANRWRDGRFKTDSAVWIKRFGSGKKAREGYDRHEPLQHAPHVARVVRRYWRVLEEQNSVFVVSIEPPLFLTVRAKELAPEQASIVEAMPYWPIGLTFTGKYVWEDDKQLDAPDYASLCERYAADLKLAYDAARRDFSPSFKENIRKGRIHDRVRMILSKPDAAPRVHPWILGVISQYYLAYERIAQNYKDKYPQTDPSVLTIEGLMGKYDDLLQEIHLPYQPVS